MVKSRERKSRKSDLPLEPCPWLVYTYGQHMKDQLFCSVSEPRKIYHKRIPQMSGDSDMVAYCSGWFLVSEGDDEIHLSLWNPTISHSLIKLPPLSLKPTQKISYYFLSSPPGDPDCKVILFENVFRSIIFIHLEAAKDKQWTKIPYAKLISSFEREIGETRVYLQHCVSCNGKLYSFTRFGDDHLVTLNIDKANRLHIEPLCQMPRINTKNTLGKLVCQFRDWLIECYGELFYVHIVFGGSKFNEVTEVMIFKLDFERMVWETTESLMGQAFFLDGVGASCHPALGIGVEHDSIYFTCLEDKRLYSFNVKYGCLSVSLPCPSVPTPWISMILVPHDVWLSRTCMQMEYNGPLLSKDEQSEEFDKKEEKGKTRFFDLPLDSLMKIADCLSLLDYLNFRTVCQNCHFIVPKLQSRQALQRLKTCPSSSPMWLLIYNNDMAAFKLVDPIHGTSLLINIPESLKGSVVCYSRNGWLLMSDGKSSLSFLNPFTEEIIKLPTPPEEGCASSYGMAFSSLPTSLNCLVVGYGFYPFISQLEIMVNTMKRNKQWLRAHMELDTIFCLNSSCPIFYRGSFYFLGLKGNLLVLNYEEEEVGLEVEWNVFGDVLTKPKTPCRSFHQNFLLECDGKLMSIFVGEMGKWLQVFSLNFTTMRWEKVESLGNHVIYVSRCSCVSAEARIMGTENRIYFPRFHGNRIIYYSLEIKKFHFDGQDTVESFYDTKEPLSATWIEPSYSYLAFLEIGHF